MYHGKTTGIVIPAHNEAASIGRVTRDLKACESIVDHIVVCDNASTDNTAELARLAGATVATEPRKGYGAACLRAIDTLAQLPLGPPDWVVFVDGDAAMDVADLPILLDSLRGGADLVIGSRQLGARLNKVEPGALTPHQRWGNWLAAWLLTQIFRARVTDLGPFRAISWEALQALGMRDLAYGWTVEMQARALAADMSVIEVPVASLRRIGQSKVSGTWRGSIGASVGILGTIARIGLPALWSQVTQSLLPQPVKLESASKDSLWKKPS